MSDELRVPSLPPKRIRHDGICVRCNTECHREPGGTWYNFYGRDQCKLDPDEGPHVVREFTEQQLEPVMIPAMATVWLTCLGADGKIRVEDTSVPEGAAFDVAFPEPLTVTGMRLELRPPRLS